MKTFIFNKIVRDNVITSIAEHNVEAEMEQITQEQKLELLKNKLVEEANEVLHSKNSEETIYEIADLLEVIDTIKNMSKISEEDIQQARAKKLQTRGGFKNNIFLKSITLDEKSENATIKGYVEYLKQNPDRYPELPYVVSNTTKAKEKSS